MNQNNGITNKVMRQAEASEDFFRKMPQRLAEAHVYIKDNNLDMKIYSLHDELVIEGKDVKKKSKHLKKVMEIINGGKIIKQY